MKSLLDKVIDQYRLSAIINDGSSGCIFQARDLKHNSEVLLKLVDPALSRQKTVLNHFRELSKQLAKLKSEHVPRVRAMKQLRKGLIIVMEPVQGQTLAEYLQEQGPLEWPAVLAYARQIARGIKDGFSEGGVHLELNPQSIMIEPSGCLKITDFGFAGLMDADRDSPGAVQQSCLLYASPEQLRGAVLDERSYIYSMGVLLYEMFCGRFSDAVFSTTRSLDVALMKGLIAPLSVQQPSLPLLVVDMLMSAIEKRPRERFESIDMFLSCLREIEEVEGISGVFAPDATTAGNSPFSVGTMVGQYKLAREMGHDERGTVYQAVDIQHNRKVAMRLLPKGAIRSHEMRQRFMSELEASSALKHFGVTRIHEICHFQGRDIICAEWVDGRSLKAILKDDTLSADLILTIAMQVAETLQRAHESGIVHGDLKPSNIIVSPEGMIKVRGFGISTLINRQAITDNRTVLGNFAYLSPEILLGNQIDHTCDIFSFGVILYEMIKRENPFRKAEDRQTIYSIIMNERPVMNGSIRSDIPGEMVEIIERSLQKFPHERYHSLQQILEVLVKVRSKIHQSDQFVSRGEASGDTLIEFKSIETLLEERQKIDQMIEAQHTKNTTVMFCDLAGSTAFFESRGDLEGRAMVQEYYGRMFPVIKRHQGIVIKTIGDGILASFDDAAEACHCAMEMQRSAMRKNRKKMDQDRMSIRIALHYGKAVIETGDIFGDVVNVAARIEQHGAAGEIVISETVYDQCRHNHDLFFFSCGDARFKGKTDMVPLYKLLWRRADIDASHKGLFETEVPVELVAAEAAPVAVEAGPAPTPAVVDKSRAFPGRVADFVQAERPADREKNPYMNRVKIKDIGEFYGRQNEVTKIFARLGATRPQSISIVGERRIGKSSLLNYISHPINRQRYLKKVDAYGFVYIDWQERSQLDPAGFIETIYVALRSEFAGRVEIDAEATYAGFKEIITRLEHLGYKLILVFDEFECITRNSRFDTEFYSFCRSIANNYNVAYVVGSGRNLQSMCYSKEIADSPFFNIFSNVTLSQFSYEETIELVIEPARRAGVFMDPHVPFIVDIAGCYPFFIQMACAILFDSLRSKQPFSTTQYERVKDEFWDEARAHFQQIWDTCDEEQQEVLGLLAEHLPVGESRRYLVKQLIKSGYVKAQDKNPMVFSSLFEEFIRQNQPRVPPKQKSSWFNLKLFKGLSAG